jgi:hypothetical protein
MSKFEIDDNGFRQLYADKPKTFIVRELFQNAVDEPGVTFVKIDIEPVVGRPLAHIRVEDDAPEGFYDLTHAYTLFANTRKRKDAEKRGRFNLGEKQVVALCKDATIVTTTGGVEFEGNERRLLRRKRDEGSVFSGIFPMTRDEIKDCVHAVETFMPPDDIKVYLNGILVPHRDPLDEVQATLLTEYENEEGHFRTTRRKTSIVVYETLPGETAMLYEMGIPVVETGDRWHYDVCQRVPLTVDRDNVPPSYLQDVRAEVLNLMVHELREEDASEPWVRAATADDRIEPETVEKVATKRWGENRCVVTPGDHYGREQAIARGYHVVGASEMSKDEWAQMKGAGAIDVSSQIFQKEFAPGKKIPERDWTEGMRNVARFTEKVSKLTLGFEVIIEMVNSPEASVSAQYAKDTGRVTFNVANLGERWFDQDTSKVLPLIIHELGHEYGSNHLSEDYYDGLCKIGTKSLGQVQAQKEATPGVHGGPRAGVRAAVVTTPGEGGAEAPSQRQTGDQAVGDPREAPHPPGQVQEEECDR